MMAVHGYTPAPSTSWEYAVDPGIIMINDGTLPISYAMHQTLRIFHFLSIVHIRLLLPRHLVILPISNSTMHLPNNRRIESGRFDVKMSN